MTKRALGLKIKPYRVMIEYTDGMERVYYFDTWKESYDFIVNEGDHVVDWDINGE